MQAALPIKQSISYGWTSFKERPWFFIGLSFVFVVLSLLAEFVVEMVDGIGMEALANFVWFVVQWWFTAGVLMISLSWYKSREASFDQLFSVGGTKLLYFFATLILQYLIILGGLILLIVPGLIWSVKFSFAPYFVLDQDMKPIDALKASGKLTDGFKWSIFGFYVVVGLLNLLGLLVFVVGVLVTSSVTFLAFVFIYKWLLGQREAAVFGTASTQPKEQEPVKEALPAETPAT